MKIQYHGKKLSFLCVLYIKRKGEEGYALNVVFGIAWVKIEMNQCLCCSFRRKSDRTGIEIQRIRMFLLLRFIILQFFFFLLLRFNSSLKSNKVNLSQNLCHEE